MTSYVRDSYLKRTRARARTLTDTRTHTHSSAYFGHSISCPMAMRVALLTVPPSVRLSHKRSNLGDKNTGESKRRGGVEGGERDIEKNREGNNRQSEAMLRERLEIWCSCNTNNMIHKAHTAHTAHTIWEDALTSCLPLLHLTPHSPRLCR